MVALAVVSVAAAVVLLTWWNARSQPQFVQRAHPVLHRALLYENPSAPYELGSLVPGNHPPLLVLTRLMTDRLGRNYPAIMGTQTILFVFWVAMCALAGAALGGAPGAAVSAVFAALLPLGYVTALGYDDHLFNVALTGAGAAALAWSRSLRRWPLVALAGVMAGTALHYCFIVSNGVLTAFALASAAVGAGIEGLVEQGRRLRVAVGQGMGGTLRELRPWLVGALVFVAMLIVFAGRKGTYGYLTPGYFVEEVGNAPARSIWDWFVATPVYLYLIARYLLGPIGLIAAVIGGATLARRQESGRWLLWVWLALPLVVLSLSPKKNPYYIYYALAAAPVMAGVGLTRLKDPVRRIGLIFLLAAGGWAWTLWHATENRQVDFDSTFIDYTAELSAYCLHAPYTEADPHVADADGLLKAARAVRPEGRLVLMALGEVGPMEMLRYFLQLQDPRAAVFAVYTSNLSPPQDIEPLFLIVRERDDEVWGASIDDALRITIERINRHLESTQRDALGTIETAGDLVARMSYLKRFVETPYRFDLLFESERFRLYNPVPEAPNP